MKVLKPESYWKWRHKIEEMKHAESKISSSRLMSSLMEKEIENQKLKVQLYGKVIKDREDSHSELKKQYEEIKLELEVEIGESLNGCTISDSTFEVTKLEE